ncbi:MAG: CBS domain-containing protein [Mariprofundaceae bacterium]|nr:CBS domain-containing protein [Mariprofundaceae bacterium]
MFTAQDIMNPNPEHCLLDAPIDSIIQRFAAKDMDSILVIDHDQRLCGIITESDLVDQQACLHVPTAMMIFDMVLPLGEEKFEREIERLQALTAEELMVSELRSVAPSTTLDDIASLMSEAHVHHLPVIQDGSVEGIITKHDVIRALAKRL